MKIKLLLLTLLITLGSQIFGRVLGPRDRIEITFKKGRSEALNTYGDIDDTIQKFKPEIKILTRALGAGFTGNNATIVFLAENIAAKNNWKVISTQSFNFDFSKKRPFEWNGKKVETMYDDGVGADHGFKYDGYVIVIKNSEDEIVNVKTSRKAWGKVPEKIIKLKEKQLIDKDFFKK